MTSHLNSAFYQSTDVLYIAKSLLGKQLISTIDGKRTSGIIVETEAYRAPDDKGCHAYNNRLTERTSTMYEAGGTIYVYVCYGIHHLFNVVSAPKGMAHAVLIRAIEPIEGIDIMLKRRAFDKLKVDLTNGPGKFTQAMGISTAFNNTNLLNSSSQIKIDSSDIKLTANDIIEGPRVGMGKSVAECSNWPWRFRVRGNKWTSKPNKVYYDWA